VQVIDGDAVGLSSVADAARLSAQLVAAAGFLEVNLVLERDEFLP
jgi:hypothetical protein